MSSSNSSFEQVIKWIVVVILAIVALKVVATVLGIAFFLGGFLLSKVLPLVLMVWLIYAIIQWLGGKKGSSTSTTDF
jgi:TRAP-type C4-dicarboxylate transport system permease small subunit